MKELAGVLFMVTALAISIIVMEINTDGGAGAITTSEFVYGISGRIYMEGNQ